jgi:hypothetical protein
MIPPRMLSNENEIFGTGNALKNRVTACRRRIRLNRTHRTQENTRPSERLLESANRASEFPGYLKDELTVRSPLIDAPVIHTPDPESPQPVAELEVGIT